jgi:hypothetical protein
MDGADWASRTRFFGLVRLLQAAGAYARLTAVKGLASYARFLPRALSRAAALAGDLPPGPFPAMRAFLEGCLERLPRALAVPGACAP